MTEKERHDEFNSEDNWTPSVEFPSNGLIRVMAFEFYDLTFYKLQTYENVYEWSKDYASGKCVDEWRTKFMFIREGGHLKVIGKSQAYELMKEAEKKEMES